MVTKYPGRAFELETSFVCVDHLMNKDSSTKHSENTAKGPPSRKQSPENQVTQTQQSVLHKSCSSVR